MSRRGQPGKFLSNPVNVLIWVEEDTRTRARKLDLNMSEICRNALIVAVKEAEGHYRFNPYY